MYRTLSTLLLGLLLATSGVKAQQPVLLTASHSPPYTGSELSEKGLAIEIVSHVLKRAGYIPQIEFNVWSRAMEGVSVGLYDALASTWYSDEQAEEFIYSDAYLDSRLILLKLRSDPVTYLDTSSLKGKRIGVSDDYAYGINMDEIPGLTEVPENHAIQNLLDLLNGKVDVIIGDQRTLAMQIHKYLHNDMQKFEVTDVKLPNRGRYLAASREIKSSKKLVVDFNRALASTRNDGSYAAIVAKWEKRYPLH